MRLLWVPLVCVAGTARAEPEAETPATWRAGEHLTGEWGGTRDKLADHGITVDAVYTAEAYSAGGNGAAALGHVDLALTVDTKKIGLWPGGTFYVLGQNNHGTGINDKIGSDQTVSNLEAGEAYTQLTEAFYEQRLFDDKLGIRAGKQDANRDWGTPRYGGNLINNNFGMFPNVPLPSYPTTGLGIAARYQATPWLLAKAGLYEGSPEIGSYGFDTAFHQGAGWVGIAGAAATRHYGPNGRDDGTTSIGIWHQRGEFLDVGRVPNPMSYHGNDGFFVQHDEHVYLHPNDDKDATGLTVILRFAWARPDRSEISRFASGSVAWHGLPVARPDDTIALGFGYFTLAQPDGMPGPPTDELFVELSYKLRVTKFASLQPDIQVFRHPGGAGDNAFLAGARLKLKL